MKKVVAMFVLSSVAFSPAMAVWPFKSKKEEPSKFVTPPKADAKPGVAPASPVPRAQQAATSTLRVSHLKFQDAERERGFLELTMSRVRTREDLTVIERLVAEKRMEVAKFTQQLDKEFGVKGDGNYQYDKAAGAIFELTAKPAAAGATNAMPTVEKKQLLKFDSGEKESRFVRLASSKRLSTEQIRILRLLEEEKRLEQKTIEQALLKNFNVAAEKNYEYDIDTKTIYELVAVPEGKGGQAEVKK